jgi:tetratricopeptide (TPR) repeat protein
MNWNFIKVLVCIGLGSSSIWASNKDLVETLIDQAFAYQDLGLPQKTLATLDKALEATAEDASLLALNLKIYPLRATCLEELDAIEKAITELKKALQLLNSVTDPKGLILEEITTQLAWIYHEADQQTEAELILVTSLSKQKNTSDIATQKIKLPLLLTLGQFYEEHGKTQDALKTFEKASQLEKSIYIKTKNIEFSAHIQWVLLLEVVHNLNQARKIFQELLILIETVDGAQSNKLAKTLERVADRTHIWGHLEEASDLYHSALDIHKRRKSGPQEILRLLQKLIITQSQGRAYDHALRDAIELRRLLEADDPFNSRIFASLVLKIAGLQENIGNLKGAGESLETALKKLASVGSMASEEYLRLRFHSGILLSKQGESRKAQFILESIWLQLKDKLRKEPKSLLLLAAHANRMGHYIRAMRYLETCLGVLNAPEFESSARIEPLILMSAVFDKIRRPNESKSRLEEAFNILRRTQGDLDTEELQSHLKRFIDSFNNLKQVALKLEAETLLHQISSP